MDHHLMKLDENLNREFKKEANILCQIPDRQKKSKFVYLYLDLSHYTNSFQLLIQLFCARNMNDQHYAKLLTGFV